jgi:acyl phosphate:glycerol-3-phosphate acyltransferase
VLVAAAHPVAVVGVLVGSYLLGTLPTALAVGRRRGVDPTAAGSGNPGATNVYRTAGRRAGVLTLIGDLAKGALAAGVGWAVGGRALGVWCGVAAVLGHVAPATRRFQGGKGVATSAGMALVLFPLPLLGAVAAFAVVTRWTRVVALGSIVAAVALPLGALVLGSPGSEVAALVVCAVLVIARHRANIARLRRGAEHELGLPD